MPRNSGVSRQGEQGAIRKTPSRTTHRSGHAFRYRRSRHKPLHSHARGVQLFRLTMITPYQWHSPFYERSGVATRRSLYPQACPQDPQGQPRVNLLYMVCQSRTNAGLAAAGRSKPPDSSTVCMAYKSMASIHASDSALTPVTRPRSRRSGCPA